MSDSPGSDARLLQSSISKSANLTVPLRRRGAVPHAAIMMHLGLRLTPHGHLVCDTAADMPGMEEAVAARIEAAFAHGSGHGLLRLGAGEVGRVLPPIFGWWREFAARYV